MKVENKEYAQQVVKS